MAGGSGLRSRQHSEVLRGSGRSQAAPEDEKRHREGMTGLLDVVWFLP